MYTYHANLAPTGPKPDWRAHKWRGKSGHFHGHHVGHAGHPGFDPELTLRWGPKEREYRERVQQVLQEEEEHKRTLAQRQRSMSDGNLRRAEAERGRRDNRHHFSNQPWRCGKWAASPQTRTPSNPARIFNETQARSPAHLFSYYPPIEASESAVRMFEALGPSVQPDPSEVHVCRPWHGVHQAHVHDGQQHGNEKSSHHHGRSSPSSPHHRHHHGSVSEHSQEKEPALLVAEDTIPGLGHRCFRPGSAKAVQRPSSAPAKQRPARGRSPFAERIPAPGNGPPRKVSHRELLTRKRLL